MILLPKGGNEGLKIIDTLPSGAVTADSSPVKAPGTVRAVRGARIKVK
jgi:hypothetical protein